MHDEHLPRTDRIARQAAILLETGKAAGMSQAIRLAADTLKLTDGPMPGHGTVRKHAQAMALQALGDAQYMQCQQAITESVEELMTVLDEAELSPRLMGRAAAGHFDADATVHIRLHTDASQAELAELLVGYGYEEPSFDTVHTMHGPLNRLRFTEQGLPVTITRCPKSLRLSPDIDLFTGKAIASADIQTLRRQLRAISQDRP